MKALLIFPPGWMQFGPYLALPLLKGYLAKQGISVDIRDMNIEFYDWLLTEQVVASMAPRLQARERRGQAALGSKSYARLCKALLEIDEVATSVEAAKEALKTPARYLDTGVRERAKKTIGAALNIVESGYDRQRLTLNQIHFGSCGMAPDKILPFTSSDENVIKRFYEERGRALLCGEGYDFIGFSLPAWEQLVPALTLARCLRGETGPDVHFCMGGNYVTRLVGAWGSVPHPYTSLIDSFSVYEGEESLRQLLDTLATGGALGSVSNLVYREGKRLFRTEIGTVDVNAVPAPEFEGLPLDRYLAPEPILPLFTSRSCPYKCSFCTIPYASSEFRQRSAERVAEDLATLVARHGVRLFTFVDETLTVPSLEGISREIVERGLDIRWYGETRFHPRIDRRLAAQLFRSGCLKLQFGLESYSQRVLNLMKKGTRLEHILPNIEHCLSEGIAIHLFTFVGFPGETAAEARSTHEFSNYVLKISAETYGNDFSSLGLGPFGLEVYSDVYQHPERYGVEILSTFTDGDVEEMFEVRYRVSSGLSHEEAESLVAEFEDRLAFEDVCAELGLIWLGALAGSGTNEDEAFLLYSLTGQARMPRATEGVVEGASAEDAAEGMAPVGLAHGAHRRPLRLGRGVTVRRFSDDFMRLDAGSGGPVLAFYDHARGTVVNVPEGVGQVLERWLADGAVPAGGLGEATRAHLERLLRQRLVTVPGDGVRAVLPAAQLGRDGLARVMLNPDVALMRTSARAFVLFNRETQEMTAVNPVVAWMVSLLGGEPRGPSPVEAFIQGVLAQEPRLSHASVLAALRSLLEGGMLLLLAHESEPEPSRVRYAELSP
ncbi:B12-binding domain-containing radical SAM protein [Chondromyces apiculatus]|uniref:Radical SAM core domain-containing protein n=1 Tax=Chondromyces apiculatus DSM 436 TaxID=1192034 RepID=A0A017T5Q7_9BACT|nr:radical SAM protein [Chondromyces apiculatus]EYF04130.1 Hypothetical protein CAP_4813 [Chondromyces apiculatus DSM 436]